jgi:hypothetical protein
LPLALVTLGLLLAGCGTVSQPGELGFSPAPDTPTSSPESEITVRGATAAQLSDISVVGSQSGRHPGRFVADRDERAATFLPYQSFAPGEHVTVSLRVAGVRRLIRYHFTVAEPAPVMFQAGNPGKPAHPNDLQHFHSEPGLRPPTVTVSVKSSASARGDIFLAPANKLGQPGPLIIDGRGQPIWFHPLPGKLQAFGFREQHYEGKPVLTWWQGVVSSLGFGRGVDVIYDTHYRRIATVHAAEGYQADLHDFVITPRGTALITIYNPVQADLSSLGGAHHGIVYDCVIQEIDIKTGRVLFEWHSLGHVGLDETYFKPTLTVPDDYFHLNSIALDRDGNLIVSARNTWTIYKISHRTGQIIWRLGGKRSNFTMGPGTQFAYQHDAQRQPDGTITLFDNGSNPQVHPQSRAIALTLNMKTMTATLVHQWTHPDKLVASSQGNVQLLPNGDRFVGWGGEPNLTEFSPDGDVLFDAAMAAPDTSYRAYRFPWNGIAPGRPAIALAASGRGKVTVYASWNGATNVARWRILAGPSPHLLAPIAEVSKTGFETKAVVFPTASYLAVQALSASGRILGVSAAARGRLSQR